MKSIKALRRRVSLAPAASLEYPTCLNYEAIPVTRAAPPQRGRQCGREVGNQFMSPMRRREKRRGKRKRENEKKEINKGNEMASRKNVLSAWMVSERQTEYTVSVSMPHYASCDSWMWFPTCAPPIVPSASPLAT